QFVAAFPKNFSRMVQVLYGQTITQIRCMNTAYKSVRHEVFSTLSLPLKEDSTTLYDCLDTYFKEEVIQDFYDDESQHRDSAKKRHQLFILPPVLIITLIRFDARGNKVHHSVDLPHNLDMVSYVHPGSVSASSTYKLFGLV